MFETFLIVILFACLASIVGAVLESARLAWHDNFGQSMVRCFIVLVVAWILLVITGMTGSLLYG